MNDTIGRSQSSEPAADKHRFSPGMSPRTFNFLAVQVVASDGRSLNPCHPARARELIRKQRAVRISRQPYTIRLLSPHRSDESDEASDSPEASP